MMHNENITGTVGRLRPLHGSKTHPLTPHALGVMRSLWRAPMPRQAINPGVIDRFEREGLIAYVQLASPYKTHKGKLIEHVQLSQIGIAVLRTRGQIND